MKILALGAHPDDIEIFMYGLICIYKNQGNKVFTMVATDGAKGGSQENNLLTKQRVEETTAGLKDLSEPVFLNIPDSELGEDPVHQKIIKENILNIMPDLIITHSKHDYHADHRSLSLLTSSAVSHYIPILYCDTLMGVNFEPDVYVDITEYIEEKKEAIMNHKSQNPKRLIEIVKTMNRYRSLQCNGSYYQYVETFKIPKQFPFLDLRNMIPKSLSIQKFNLTNTN